MESGDPPGCIPENGACRGPSWPDVSELYGPDGGGSGRTGYLRDGQHGQPVFNNLESNSESQDEIGAPVDGELISMEKIPDPVFSSGTLGQCVGILPKNGIVYAPCQGKVSFVAETGHAIAFSLSDGRNIILHVGIDTVGLEGRGFRVMTERGKTVSKEDIVMKVDLEEIRKAGLSPMVITVVER